MSENINHIVFGSPVVLANAQSMPGIPHNEGAEAFQDSLQYNKTITPQEIARREAHATRQKKRYHDKKANERQKYKERGK